MALLALREKKLGTSLPFSSRTLSSPDAASVLVPSSSTSFPPRFPDGAQRGSPQPGPSYSSGPSLIRSSNIWGLHANGSSSSSGFPGSPLAVVSAIHNRRAAEDLPRKAGESSLSYEPSLSDLSPSSPQPLSRLKARYTDTTPTKPSLGESSRIPVSRSPSLVAAAQQQINADEEKLIGRLAIQFSRVKRSIIASCVRRHAGDPDRAINEVQYINEQGRSVSPESDYVSSPARPAVPASRPAIPRPPVPVVTQPPPPAPRPIPKPKKNEKSAIYANRGSSGKRRDPDDSELEADGSGGESEMDWSGDDGPKRKRRKGIEQEMDAEGVALKAFNENAVEELTGTIGE